MPPTSVVWPLEPHTRGKHLVLRNYMEAWLPIMGTRYRQINFIDAFAGPGEYSGGEAGSPILALRTLIEHSAQSRLDCKFVYTFIEEDKKRHNHLKYLLQDMESEIPTNCTCRVLHNRFDEAVNMELDKLDYQNTPLAPSLVMIDPFGIKDTPMKTIGRILSNPSSEVYISFMYDFISRFHKTDEFESPLSSLFGCEDWRGGLNISDAEPKKQFYFDLYEHQLKANGAKYVLRFELYEGERLVYAIFFGTSSLDGCDKMKQAIWKEAPSGNYKFKGNLIGQLSFGDGMIDFTKFRESLVNEFGSAGWVTIDKVTDFVKSDSTGFHRGHLKNKTLAPMEKEGAIEVDTNSRKGRKGSYPPDTRLRFICVQGQPEIHSPSQSSFL